MVETCSVEVGLHQGDEVVCLARSTRGTKALAFGAAGISDCESVSKYFQVSACGRLRGALGLSCEGDAGTAVQKSG